MNAAQYQTSTMLPVCMSVAAALSSLPDNGVGLDPHRTPIEITTSKGTGTVPVCTAVSAVILKAPKAIRDKYTDKDGKPLFYTLLNDWARRDRAFRKVDVDLENGKTETRLCANGRRLANENFGALDEARANQISNFI